MPIRRMRGGALSPATRSSTPTGRVRVLDGRASPTPKRGLGRGSPVASSGKGIDDAILLMVSLVFKNMEGYHATVISNDRFREYPGQRIFFDEMQRENSRASSGASAASSVRPPAPNARTITGDVGEDVKESILIKSNFTTRLTGPDRMKEIYIKTNRGWENICTSKTFKNICSAVLNEKLNAAGYFADVGPSVIRGFALEVCRMATNIAHKSTARIFYIVDVENLFFREAYEQRLPPILDVANIYIRRRWKDQLANERGRNVSLIFPLFTNRFAKFDKARRRIMTGRLRSAENAFNVDLIPYSLDFFNKPIDRPTKKMRTGLVDLNTLLIKLRF